MQIKEITKVIELVRREYVKENYTVALMEYDYDHNKYIKPILEEEFIFLGKVGQMIDCSSDF